MLTRTRLPPALVPSNTDSWNERADSVRRSRVRARVLKTVVACPVARHARKPAASSRRRAPARSKRCGAGRHGPRCPRVISRNRHVTRWPLAVGRWPVCPGQRVGRAQGLVLVECGFRVRGLSWAISAEAAALREHATQPLHPDSVVRVLPHAGPHQFTPPDDGERRRPWLAWVQKF